MRLVDVYHAPEAAVVLYRLLKERGPEQNISHKHMPNFAEHAAFMRSRPYLAWYLIMVEQIGPVGAVYLSRQQEVGLFVFKEHQGKGYGEKALAAFRLQHPGRLLANVSPLNERGKAFWQKQGFELIQETFVYEPNTTN